MGSRGDAERPRKLDVSAAIAAELAKIVVDGMNRVLAADLFAGSEEIENVFHTHFPMPDGREWELVLKRRRATNG